MAYTNSEPSPSQFISAGQGTILGNFQAIDTGTSGDLVSRGFNRNHYTMTDGTNGGFHFAVTYPSPPGILPSLSGTQSSVYPKAPVSAQELFFANASVSAQITNTALTASSGEGMSPGGLQIRTATAAAATGAGNRVNFSTPFPNHCLSVVVSYVGGGFGLGQTCSASIIDNTAFTAFTSGGATGIFYIAIGY